MVFLHLGYLTLGSLGISLIDPLELLLYRVSILSQKHPLILIVFPVLSPSIHPYLFLFHTVPSSSLPIKTPLFQPPMMSIIFSLYSEIHMSSIEDSLLLRFCGSLDCSMVILSYKYIHYVCLSGSVLPHSG